MNPNLGIDGVAKVTKVYIGEIGGSFDCLNTILFTIQYVEKIQI